MNQLEQSVSAIKHVLTSTGANRGNTSSVRQARENLVTGGKRVRFVLDLIG